MSFPHNQLYSATNVQNKIEDIQNSFRRLLPVSASMCHPQRLTKEHKHHHINYCSTGQLKLMAHGQKPDFVFRRNRRVHLNRRGRQFSRLLAAEVCALAVVMLDKTCSEVVWIVLATHSIPLFLLHVPYRASPCAITFRLESTWVDVLVLILRICNSLRIAVQCRNM